VGVDNRGKVGEDLTAQTTLAYASIKTVLAEFGANIENIVDETFFVTNMAEFMGSAESVFTARAEAYGGMPEVSQTVVQVVALVQPELKIEIKCVAHL
jgi:enamine deaminase RidA (YjgF/YER057c/UK114 family)